MSKFRILFLGLIAVQAVALAGCATTEGSEDKAQNDAGIEIPVSHSDGSVMRHNLRQIVEYDAYKMVKLVNKEMNMNEEDEDRFVNDAAIVLAQTVMVQPHFTEREEALRELKGKLDQEDWTTVVEKAADNLLGIVTSSPAPSDQATAMVGLTNLVVEMRSMKRAELKPVLQRIADANLKISSQARKYAVEPMEKLVSPSVEAQTALKTL